MKGKWLTAVVCLLLLIFGIAVAALMQKRAKIPELVMQLGAADYGDAQDAMRELTTMRALVIEDVCDVLANPTSAGYTDPQRWRAALVLGDIGGERAVEVLLRALKESESKDVQWNCIVALGKLGATEAAEELIRILQDDDMAEVVRLTAIRTLGLLDAQDAVGPLIGQLEKRPDAQQVIAERRAEEREAKEAQERADERKKYEDADLPVPAHLLEQEVAEEEEEAAEITDADRPQLRIASCEALAMLGDKEAVPPLCEAADSSYEPEYSVRIAAIVALGDLADASDEQVIDVLVRNLKDVTWDMNADGEDDDPDGDVRVAAAHVLRRLGGKNDTAVAALQRAADDKHYWVRFAATESIE
ncbi:MAG: HEAT repeat domain-containing protein [Armatimonadota bacterium]|jgi:HEAT repeat protein